MTLDQVPARAHVFVDSNILVYHFQPHPGLTHLASHDAHFDSVSAVTRYAPR